MSENQDFASEIEKEDEAIEMIDGEEMSLDDARRVKVLSPGMLVFKRFIRNKLAVIGFVIIMVMFLLAFAGPLFSPYGQAQVFTGLGSMSKDYAGAIYNEELRYTIVDGETFSSATRAQFLLAVSAGDQAFSYGDDDYYFSPVNDDTYLVTRLQPVAVTLLGELNSIDGSTLDPEFVAAYEAAIEEDESGFTLDGIPYRITIDRKQTNVSIEDEVALASLTVYDAYNEEDLDIVRSFDFQLISQETISAERRNFSFDGEQFTIHYLDGQITISDSNDEDFAEVSNIIVNPLDQSQFISVAFKTAVREAIVDLQPTFTFVEDGGEEIVYMVDRVNTNYYIKKETPTTLIRQYELPSWEHPLGLDNNGMDVMTRLMYGGRVSLLVGFVVVSIEVVIGVIVGGISGYFGGWVDTSLMRFVDLFNAIPFYPIVLILGSVMDTLQMDPRSRIFLLMMVLGLLGWTGVARVVRGQILSLREQDFMVATEATGISTRRRIFTHLVPNVMPLLIVQATAGLGGIIIAEATLGFLGLGAKYPLASWGSIINTASDAYVMTNFWFMWIPAGSLILLAVLGFNFIGDGLRDAFDPKMKR
ncbi:MAG: ABC transporter permease [Anaerolineaceae bacterium]|nr:ABC transporter permease [Anaerolineaceae bacterium]